MATYKTPGVYVEEIASLPPSVVAVSTAIPAFIGYTQKRPSGSIEAHRINSMQEFEMLFGGAFPETFSASVTRSESVDIIITTLPTNPQNPDYRLFYSLQMFYTNGGGACYIVSVGTYPDGSDTDEDDSDTDVSSLLLHGLVAIN